MTKAVVYCVSFPSYERYFKRSLPSQYPFPYVSGVVPSRSASLASILGMRISIKARLGACPSEPKTYDSSIPGKNRRLPCDSNLRVLRATSFYNDQLQYIFGYKSIQEEREGLSGKTNLDRKRFPCQFLGQLWYFPHELVRLVEQRFPFIRLVLCYLDKTSRS